MIRGKKLTKAFTTVQLFAGVKLGQVVRLFVTPIEPVSMMIQITIENNTCVFWMN